MITHAVSYGETTNLMKCIEQTSYIKENKLLNICWKCKRAAIDGFKKLSEIKEFVKCVEHNPRLSAEDIPAKHAAVDDGIETVRG